MPPRLLAIDPGLTIGLALFNENGNIVKWWQINIKDLTNWLEDLEPKPEMVLYEEFALFKNKALQQSGSKMEASQAIGQIKSYCTRHKIAITHQPANILGIAVKMTQMPLPKDHSYSHWVSAYNHGMYWLIKNGYREVAM